MGGGRLRRLGSLVYTRRSYYLTARRERRGDYKEYGSFRWGPYKVCRTLRGSARAHCAASVNSLVPVRLVTIPARRE